MSKKGENREWRKFHYEELHSLYRSHDRVRTNESIRWAGHVARMEEVRSNFKI